MKNKSFQRWSNNRARAPLAKFHNWRGKPLGLFVRAAEIAFIGAPLQQIIRSNNDIDEIKHLLPHLNISGEERDFHISDAQVSTKNALVLLESGHIISRHLNSHSYLSGNLNDEVRALIKKKPLQLELDPILVLPKQDYFYHFLIDYLPHIIRIHLEVPKITIIVNQDENNFVTEYLKIHNIRFMRTKAKTISGKLIIVPNYSSLNLNTVRSLLCYSDSHENILPSAPEKIALLRFRGSRHDVEFEKKLKVQLIKNNFIIFDPDSLSILEQINLFSGAIEIVAIHGGALTNLIYCKEGTSVHEIFTHPYRTMFFMAISKEIGLKYSSSESADFKFDLLL